MRNAPRLWRVITNGRGWFVSYVDDAGPAARHIQRGDRLLAINDDERYAVMRLLKGVPSAALALRRPQDRQVRLAGRRRVGKTNLGRLGYVVR